MARTTKQLSGAGKDKFLRASIARVASLEPAVARHIADSLCGAIADIRVRREAWHGTDIGNIAECSSGPTEEARDKQPKFDPYVFSALSVLTKQGVGGLKDRLASIESVENLQALARAQHLSVDAALGDLAALRAAILAATEGRLAERRAAAS